MNKQNLKPITWYNLSSERKTKSLSTVEEHSEKSEENSANLSVVIDVDDIEAEPCHMTTPGTCYQAAANHVNKSCDDENQSDTGSVSTPDTVILTG